jgi:DNA-binding PadR family transcriptional regulator
MTSRSGRFTSKNNVQGLYIQEIDRAIIDVLSSGKMNYRQLKKEVEKRCKRTIPPKTWSTHLKTMQKESYLIKDDTGQRTRPVYYSLTEYARQLRDLKILCMDPQRVVFLQIYANLFSGVIIEGNTYVGVDLENILNEIHTSRQELCVVAIKKKSVEYEEYEEKPELTTLPERPLRTYTAIYYKPTSLGVKIIETTSYRENIFYKNRVEDTAYTYTVPGVSIEDLTHKYYTFNPRVTDCESALELLLQRNVISPIMDFRGKTRYVIADPELTNFITELYSFCEQENEFLNSKWQYLDGP